MSATSEIEAFLVAAAQGALSRSEVAELRKQLAILVKESRANEAQLCVNVVEELAINTADDARRDAYMTAAAAVWEHRLKK